MFTQSAPRAPGRWKRKMIAIGCAAALSAGSGLVVAAGAASAQTGDSSTTTTGPPAVQCPASTPNGKFVRFIYLVQLLNRCPDPAGAAFWTKQLDNGLSRATFTEMLDNSDENIWYHNVIPLFGEALGRAPSSNELAFWSTVIRQKRGDAELIAWMLSSDEFYNGGAITGATKLDKDKAWLDFAYNLILDRNQKTEAGGADAAGQAHFLATFGAGSTQTTRIAAARFLEYSGENAADWTGAVYGAAFGRGPDAAGIQFWIGWLLGAGHWQTFQMYTNFLASPEGFNVAQTQPNPQPEGAGVRASSKTGQLRGAYLRN